MRRERGSVSAVARPIAAHLEWLDQQIAAVTAERREPVTAGPMLARNLALLRSITGFGEISATVLLAELPLVTSELVTDIAEFTPKALAASVGLSPREHGSGTSVRKPGKISRLGSERLRNTLYMRALSAKRANTALASFVSRMTAAGRPPKTILVAVARELLLYAHAVIRAQTPFDPSRAVNPA